MTDLTEAGRALLEAGAKHLNGLCCTPGQVRKNWKDLTELKRAGFINWLTAEQPWITKDGREAIGAPNECQATIDLLRPTMSNRAPLAPPRDADPRTDLDYRSYQSMGWVCALVIRQPDYRTEAATIRVGSSLSSEPQFLGAGNSIVQPESEGRFVLTLVPAWMVRKNIFSGHPFSLDEYDPAFTAEERELWDRLRNICFSINTRINRGSGKAMTARSMAYGATA